MPIYEYRCISCNHKFEVLQRISEDGTDLECPACKVKNPEKDLLRFLRRGF